RGFPGFGQPGGNKDPFVVERNFPSASNDEFKGFTLDARRSGETVDVVSITGYLDNEEWVLSDFDASPASFFETSREQYHEQFSQELRVESKSSGRLQWVTGVYYAWQEFDIGQTHFLGAY